MTVTVLSGRLFALGDSRQDPSQFAPVRSTIRIGDTLVNDVVVPDEADPLLVPGRQMALHIVGAGPKVLFAVETEDGRMHDFSAAVVRRARVKKRWAVALILFSMLLTGMTLVGVVVWPFFLALLAGALHTHFVPSRTEMRHHLRVFGEVYHRPGQLAGAE